jgi:hypothetical protein
MSLQAIIDTAQNIEFSRASLVASSVSRSGKIITQARNWVKPWSIKVSPAQVYAWADKRGALETILNADRHTEQTIYIGATSGNAWLTAYQGNAGLTTGALTNVYITAVSGTTMTINVANAGIAVGTVILKKGDIIQPAGTGTDGLKYRYPYVVENDVIKGTGDTTKTVTLNRGYIPQANYDPTSQSNYQAALYVGNACSWKVIVTKLPAVRYLPGKLFEFTSDFELLEVVL